MSRTYKDKPAKIRFPEWFLAFDEEYYSYWARKPGILPKKKKRSDAEWHWMRSTPSSWTHLMMNRPQRRAGRIWEAKVIKNKIADLEEEDPPNVGRKPKVYYW